MSQYTYAYQPLSDPQTPLRVGPAPPSTRRRFFKAFAVAAVVCTLLHLATRTVVHLGHGHGHWYAGAGELAGPLSSDGRPVVCIEGKDWISSDVHPSRKLSDGWHEVTKEFRLPLDSEQLYFLSRGVRSFGHIDIAAREDSDLAGERDEVHIQVTAKYHRDKVMHEATVCTLKHDGKHGLGIFTPKHNREHEWEQQLRWDVVVSLPAGADVRSLLTSMPIFPHTINGSGIYFEDLTLTTTNAKIALDAIEAKTVLAHTTNGAIVGAVNASSATLLTTNGRLSGAYNVSHALVLHTTNAAVDVAVQLNHAGGDTKRTSADMGTTNGRFNADVVLAAATESGWGGSFHVGARTSNSPLFIDVKDSPADSALSLEATTSNGPAKAKMHRAFEGSFYAKTSTGRVTLNTPKNNDPRGEDRKRVVDQLHWDSSRRSVSGHVHWGEEEHKDRGLVVLTTSNAPADLTI